MSIRFGGRFRYEILIPGEKTIKSRWSNNGIITATIDDLWDVYFSNGTPQAAWYGGLITNTAFTALLATDTMASHSTWQEATNYTGSRPAWAPGDSAGGVKTNSAAMEFPIATEEALRGMFLVSDNTKGGSAGLLWATGEFDTGPTTPPVGSTFKLFYELTGREG